MNIEIKECKESNWKEFRNIRLDSLKYEPEAFSSLFEETEKYPDSYWIDMVSDSNNIILLAYADNVCVGIIRGAFKDEDVDENTAFIGSFYVNSNFRRKGIGKVLMNGLISRIQKNSEISFVRLWVNIKQSAAIQFYVSLGFIQIGEEKAGNDIELIFEKKLV